MKNNKDKNDPLACTANMVILHNDLAKLSSNENQKPDSKSESKALYGKEFQFYEFYFLAVADCS